MFRKLARFIINPFRIAITCLLFRNVRMLYMLPSFTDKVERCPVCKAAGVYEFTNRHTPLDRCTDCGHVYSRKAPKKRIMELVYKGHGYWKRDKGHQGIDKVEYNPQWDAFLNDRLSIATKTGVLNGEKGLKIFEIGCAEGMLLNELEKLGHQAEGCDMNVATAQAGIKSLAVKIHTEMFEDLPLKEGHYDAVLSFHTVEHLPSPDSVLKKIAQTLKSDGAVLIEVPCGPDEYTNTDHLQFFCTESLRRFIGNRFEEVQIFDNTYTTQSGAVMGSLYGCGRCPKG